jgi:hypothetical protein
VELEASLDLPDTQEVIPEVVDVRPDQFARVGAQLLVRRPISVREKELGMEDSLDLGPPESGLLRACSPLRAGVRGARSSRNQLLGGRVETEALAAGTTSDRRVRCDLGELKVGSSVGALAGSGFNRVVRWSQGVGWSDRRRSRQ